LSLALWSSFDTLREIKYIVGAVFIMFMIGFRDDLINLKASRKLLAQIAAAMIVVVISDIRLDSLYGLCMIEDVPIWISYIISVFTIIVITNAYNLIDGIDGLAGSIGLVISLFFGIWFYLVGEIGLASIALALAGCILAFLNFNWAPAKIFMGDTGSLFIGFFLSVGAIKFIDVNDLLIGHDYVFGASIGTAMAVLIPRIDTLEVFIISLVREKSSSCKRKQLSRIYTEI
jgi:UDP-N-acetylmuramyl pentapeptide phosphotransferase/UDP-N-acetylglucosamine-1-phosphate transferase